mmetsp:Transcript_34280/g.91574  ORF Transcript_34280/g.91574 Transcript_34280/m.91574 type:complete len:306 (+) Transcript_34280:2178-3095(+)
MTHIMAQIMVVGAVKEESAALKLDINCGSRSCGASGIMDSSTLNTLAPIISWWLLLQWRPPRPGLLSCTPSSEMLISAGLLKRIQASRMRSNFTPVQSIVTISSSINQMARGHSLIGSGVMHCFTVQMTDLTNRGGNFPSFRFAKHRSPRCKYSAASESRRSSTEGSPPMMSALSAALRVSVSSDSGLSTATSSSSRARSPTDASTSRINGRTLSTHMELTFGVGQVRNRSARLPTDAFRTEIDSSAERFAMSLVSKKFDRFSPSRQRGERSNGIIESKKLRAALLTVGFSSIAATRKILAKLMC